jgi:hypothetical protein
MAQQLQRLNDNAKIAHLFTRTGRPR